MQEYGDNFIPVIVSEPVHTLDQPFCLDPTCGCHEDQSLVSEINKHVQLGILTQEEALNIVRGRQVWQWQLV